MALTAAATTKHPNATGLGAKALRTPLGDVMKFEILLNENSRVWIFHDQILPGRLAWVEFDPATGMLELVPHDMRAGILTAPVPPMLHNRIKASDLVYLYMTDGDRVTGFQKAPIHIRRNA